jgi:hypothetical protein
MKIRYAIPAIALVTVVSAAPSKQRVVTMKCPNQPILFADAPEPVFVIDGKAVPQEKGKELGIAPEAVESIEIVCATDVHREFGVKANRTAVVVFTKPGPYAALKNSVESIVSMQESYHAKHGAFARTITDLPWKDETGLITVSLQVSPDGKEWFATGNHRHRFRGTYVVSGPARK